jgi:hypothetical protein
MANKQKPLDQKINAMWADMLRYNWGQGWRTWFNRHLEELRDAARREVAEARSEIHSWPYWVGPVVVLCAACAALGWVAGRFL